MNDGIWRWKNGHRIFIKNKNIKSTNDYMNEKIRQSVIRINAKESEYKKYDDDEETFKQDNPDVVLKERNPIIDEWTKDSGGWHTNSGIQKYMTETREYYKHEGWERGIKEIDDLITGKLNNSITTYRTVQLNINDLEPGKIVDEKGFIATSITRYKSVSSFNHGDSKSATIEVDVEKGTRCLYIGDKTGHNKNEHELLFPEEYQIQITKINKEYDKDGDYMGTVIKGKMIKK